MAAAGPLGSVTVGRYRLDVGGASGTLIAPARAPPQSDPVPLAQALERTPEPAAQVVGEVVDSASEVTGRVEQAVALLGDLASGRVEPREVSARVDLMLEMLARLDRQGRWKEARDLARALSGLLALIFRWVDLVRSLQVVREAAARLGDSSALAWSEHELGTLHLAAGRLGDANRGLEEAERVRREIGDKAGLAATQHNLQVLCAQLRQQLDGNGGSPGSRRILAVAVAAILLLATGGVAGAWLAHGDDGPSTTAADVGLVVTTTGAGKVTSSPAGIACPDDCKGRFPRESDVVLTARPDSGSTTFAGWSGGGCQGIRECKPRLEGETTVTGRFKTTPPGTTGAPGTPATPKTVQIEPAPSNGRVVSSPPGIDCPMATCSGSFSGTVTLMAIADDGFVLDEWSGYCAGVEGDRCAVPVNDNQTAGASFVGTVQLTVTVRGTGTVTIGALGTCTTSSSLCTHTVIADRPIVLTASGGTFKGWTPQCSEPLTSTSCRLSPTVDTRIGAVFETGAG